MFGLPFSHRGRREFLESFAGEEREVGAISAFLGNSAGRNSVQGKTKDRTVSYKTWGNVSDRRETGSRETERECERIFSIENDVTL